MFQGQHPAQGREGLSSAARLFLAALASALLFPVTVQAQILNPSNGHYYVDVAASGGITWPDAALSASQRSFAGSQGHLVTITSGSEEAFITNNFSYACQQEYVIGGLQSHGSTSPWEGWRWVTDEPWAYANWTWGEPNGVDGGPPQALQIKSGGTWNDLPLTLQAAGYIVEFDGPFAVPSVSLSSSSLNFGGQLLGTTSPSKGVILTNSGTALLAIGSVSITGASAGSFVLTAGGGSGTLVPGASRTLSVAFTPTAAGDHTATLRIVSNAGGSPHSVSLSGVGQVVAPGVSLSPDTVDFGAVPVGATSPTRNVTLSNNGSAPLTISSVSLGSVDPGSFAIVAGAGTGSLAPGESRTISVTFTPGSPGGHTATLLIASNADGSPHRVALVGIGGAPAIAISPSTLDFGSQAVGSRSGERSVTVSNTGNTPLTILSVALTGDRDFSITAGGGGTVPPGQSQSITLVFTPTALGPRRAALSVSHDGTGSPQSVSILGNGINPAPPVPGTPVVLVSPPNLTFAPLAIGSTSAPQTVVASSTGTAPLLIQSIALTGSNPGDFRLTAGGPGSVAEGASRSFGIVFTPTGAGTRTAALGITDNAPGSPRFILLIGTGVVVAPPPLAPAPAAGVSPASLSFGDEPLGLPGSPQALTLANTGAAPLLIQSIGLTGPNAADFSITAGADAGSLPPKAGRIISVRFTPTASGPRSATLEIRTNAPDSPHTVPLTGTGTLSPPAPLPGDWPVFGHDSRQLGLAPGALDPAALVPWSVTLGSRPGASPVILQGVAYIGTEADGVFAVDVTTHRVRWSRPLPAPVRSAPAAGAEVVVVSAHGLYGLNPSDGSLLWQRLDILANEDVSPMRVGDAVYIGARAASGGGAVLYAVKAATGADLWPVPAPLPDGFDNRATAAAYPELGLLFLGLGPAPTMGQASGGPAAVMAVRLSDGSPAWTKPASLPAGPPPTGVSLGWIGVPSQPVVVAGADPPLQPAVFLAAGANVVALHAITGAVLWSRSFREATLPAPPVFSSPAPQDAILFVGGASGKVYALRSSTGADAPGGLTPPFAPITGPLALAGPYLYVPTTQGLVAANAATGTKLWSSPLDAASGVAIAGGAPYVATRDTRLVGFSVPSAPPPAVIHDLAIASLQVEPRVSRRTAAPVEVTIVNRGTTTENYSLLVRVQPGQLLLPDRRGTLSPGQQVTESFTWKPAQMGQDGPKNLAAQVTVVGQTDVQPADNNALQAVTVGP